MVDIESRLEISNLQIAHKYGDFQNSKTFLGYYVSPGETAIVLNRGIIIQI
jgi:hypothetical protein